MLGATNNHLECAILRINQHEAERTSSFQHLTNGAL